MVIWAVTPARPADQFVQQRKEMVRAIASDAEATSAFINKRALEPGVMEAMGKVPRHLFVPDDLRDSAYRNRPLPIGYGQTISQPYIVALMTDLLAVRPGQRVLEIGTGSGYQAAILAEMGSEVYSIEIIEELGKQAKEKLPRLGYPGIKVRIGDGYFGWPEHAPYDAIVVTAAAGHVPPPLIRQLKKGGRMVIPVGGRFVTQQLVLISKDEGGKVTTRQILPVLFVPLAGGH